MFTLELIAKGEKEPYGTIGIENDVIALSGLDEEFYGEWLEGPIEGEDGEIVTIADGAKKFLEAVKYKMMKNIFEGELEVRGPIEK